MWWVVNATPRPLYPRDRPGTHSTGGLVGTSFGLDGCIKSRLPPGSDPRTVHPIASRYTDWSTFEAWPRDLLRFLKKLRTFSAPNPAFNMRSIEGGWLIPWAWAWAWACFRLLLRLRIAGSFHPLPHLHVTWKTILNPVRMSLVLLSRLG